MSVFFCGSKGEEAKQYEAMRLLTMRSSGRRAAAAVSSAALYAAATAVGDTSNWAFKICAAAKF